MISFDEPTQETDRPRPRRLRKLAGRFLPMIVVLAATAGAGYWFLGREKTSSVGQPLLTPVVSGPFIHEVVERGDIGSSSNVDVRCEVRMRNTQGVAILEIVPEGTYVQQGDFLVKLDDASLQFEHSQQQIVVKNSESLTIQAEAGLETAELAQQEYESGTYKQGVEEIEALVLVAVENLRRAEEYLRYSERLAAKGYVTNIQLDADRFAVQKAQKDLAVAETKRDVLVNFTKEKTMKRLQADIQAAQAKVRAAEESHQIELDRLKNIAEQIAKCHIVAPVAGQVVYANDSGRSSEPLIEEGRLVRERQTIVRLPDPKQMQVVAKVNESNVDKINKGQTVAIRVDALPGVLLTGQVRKVAEYPLPTSSFTAHVKNYATEIEVHSPPPELRPGMTAEVAILVEQRPTALQVPVQAVIERAERYYCLLANAEQQIEAREVEIGASNDKFVVIESGLALNDQVCVTPKNYLDRVDLPEVSDGQEPRLAVHAKAKQEIQAAKASKLAKASKKRSPHVVRKPVIEAAPTAPPAES